MKKFEGLSIVSVSLFNQGEEDKNRKMPIILKVLAGKAPNRIVLSGTVAENAGFQVGNSYLAQCRELDPSEEYGRQFAWSAVQKCSIKDIIDAKKDLGSPVVFDAAVVETEIPVNNEIN